MTNEKSELRQSKEEIVYFATRCMYHYTTHNKTMVSKQQYSGA